MFKKVLDGLRNYGSDVQGACMDQAFAESPTRQGLQRIGEDTVTYSRTHSCCRIVAAAQSRRKIGNRIVEFQACFKL